ncbi:kinase-like domain-containing protein [Mycena vulgaris]|nr:kinase-like domain-containing protein [Mycena vulgaris]
MEHGTVLQYLNVNGRGNVAKFLFEIAQGLHYLHSKNVVHGDLRGTNILLTQEWTACLADFGLASVSDITNNGSSTRAGSYCWTAPELICPEGFGLKFVRTAATDVYAFGCVCVELYTGNPPFSSDGAAIVAVIGGKRPGRPAGEPPMPNVLWQHVNEYWVQDPSSRPGARDLVEDMSSVLLMVESASDNCHPDGINETTGSSTDIGVDFSLLQGQERLLTNLLTAIQFHVGGKKAARVRSLLLPIRGLARRHIPENEPSWIGQSIIYQNLLSLLRSVSTTQNLGLDLTLAQYYTAMCAPDVVTRVIRSSQCRKPLWEMVVRLGLGNHQRFHDALKIDRERLLGNLPVIIESLALVAPIPAELTDDDDTQDFLDVLQDVLYFTDISQEHRLKVRQATLWAFEACDKHPSSIFIAGVTDCDRGRNFGSGYADILGASCNGQRVALRRARECIDDEVAATIRLKLCREALVWQTLNHAHILTFIGIDCDTFSPSLCMVLLWTGNNTQS